MTNDGVRFGSLGVGSFSESDLRLSERVGGDGMDGSLTMTLRSPIAERVFWAAVSQSSLNLSSLSSI